MGFLLFNIFSLFLILSFLTNGQNYVHRVGFGSCHNQLKEVRKNAFPTLSNMSIDVWIWSGDSVYNQGTGLSTLREAYEI
jgi:hypothetical protein